MNNNKSSFTNPQILFWLEYFSKKSGLDIEKIKLIDISKKKKISFQPSKPTNGCLSLPTQGDPDFFFNLWNYGLGDGDIWFKTGLEPEGDVKICKLADMIDTEIQEPSVMLIFNPNSRSSYRIGMQNDSFSQGSVRYVASEIRSIIVNKLHLDDQDTICIISGESIAVESAMIASDGQIIAVEYNKHDRFSMEENIHKFGLTNVTIIEDTSRASLRNLPVPSLSFHPRPPRNSEEEIRNLLKINPQMKFVVYTLELDVLSDILRVFDEYHITRSEVIEIFLCSNRKNVFEAKPAPWIISGEIIE